MKAIESRLARIKDLEKKLLLEMGRYRAVVKNHASFAESKRLFLIAKETDRQIKAEIEAYYKAINAETGQPHDLDMHDR